MDNDSNEKKTSQSLLEWSFPHVDIVKPLMEDFNSDDNPFSTLVTDEADPQPLNNQFESSIENQQSQHEAEIHRLRTELEDLKIQYEKKIDVANELIIELKNSLSMIDLDLINIIQEIIKKTVKKIILKEFEMDSNLITHLVTELQKYIQSKEGYINVYLSEKDYQRFTVEEGQSLLNVSIDHSLREGDIVLKSKSTEVRAILDESIDLLLKAHYE